MGSVTHERRPRGRGASDGTNSFRYRWEVKGNLPRAEAYFHASPTATFGGA